jgi:valyl-tRNA synthetase
MSKSLGNSPDPLDLIANTAPTACASASSRIAPQGQDIRSRRPHRGRQELLQQALERLPLPPDERPDGDNSSLAAILARLDAGAVRRRRPRHPRPPARHHARGRPLLPRVRIQRRGAGALRFFWNDFCDWYVEVSKAKLQAPPAVIDGAKKQLADLKAKQTELQRLLAALG